MTDKSRLPLPEASPATKGICNDERACGACWRDQGTCEMVASAAQEPLAWRAAIDNIANNLGEALCAATEQGIVDAIMPYIDELFALAKNAAPVAAQAVRDAALEDSSIETWFPISAEEIERLRTENMEMRSALNVLTAGDAPQRVDETLKILMDALEEIADVENLTATPQQFARHLQRAARAALKKARGEA